LRGSYDQPEGHREKETIKVKGGREWEWNQYKSPTSMGRAEKKNKKMPSAWYP